MHKVYTKQLSMDNIAASISNKILKFDEKQGEASFGLRHEYRGKFDMYLEFLVWRQLKIQTKLIWQNCYTYPI